MNFRLYITTALLLATMAVCFALPKPEYQSPDIIGALGIPHATRDWRSKDMARALNLQKDDRYAFISEVFARQYGTRYGEGLLFLVVDAGNFHHPRVCFGSSGFTMKELEDTELSAGHRSFKARTLLAQKGQSGFVVIYWMVINKRQVNWTGQKFQQLGYQLLNKEKIGVMGRLDIPLQGDDTRPAISLAQKFIRDIAAAIPPENAGYVFGE